jgi:hypothetical protein
VPRRASQAAEATGHICVRNSPYSELAAPTPPEDEALPDLPRSHRLAHLIDKITVWHRGACCCRGNARATAVGLVAAQLFWHSLEQLILGI